MIIPPLQTIPEMVSFLRAQGIPDYVYTTDGSLGRGDSFGIEFTNNVWTVFYSERGHKSAIRSFQNESEACGFLASEAIKYINAVKKSKL